MEPLKPSVTRSIRELRPEAAPEDVEEYERLLAERFATDPDAPPAAAPVTPGMTAAPTDARERRLAELHRRLFGH